MIEKDYKSALEELRRRYNNSEVSALIGAGFSKNVSELFLSWDELLFDMVVWLYEPEIELGFQNFNHITSLPVLKGDYKTNKVKEIINREGYLQIVSKYIEKKGIRESIEAYIEDRIPYIDKATEELVFIKNKKNIKITDESIELHTKLLKCGWDNIYTTNYDSLLEFARDKTNKPWGIIRNGSQLSFSKQKKSIIKIHGDLRNPTNKDKGFNNFEFDGNHRQRYIISKEDYDGYPSEHEAFTQLMRISLLQGTFCLFGYSGDDPNFIVWIRWVRDILIKNHNNDRDGNDVENIKIYLITLDSDEPNLEKQLFYNNHNIYVIPLNSKGVKDVIGVMSDTNDVKTLFNKLFDYITVNINAKKIYDNLWGHVCSFKTGKIFEVRANSSIINDKVLGEIYKLKSTNRIVRNIENQSNILQSIHYKETFDNQDLKLILAALKDTYYEPKYYPSLIDKLNSVLKSKEQEAEFNILKERSKTLRLDVTVITDVDDAFKYEKLLRLAFSLNFKELKKEISIWEPEGVWIQKKASLLSLFDYEKAAELLLKYIDDQPEIKERYYATQLLNIFDRHYPHKYPTIDYETQNIDGIYKLRDAFLKSGMPSKDKIKSYGNASKTHFFGNENRDYENSLRVLQFLIESGLMVNSRTGWVISSEDWYNVFKALFQCFPYPVLYYSIQVGDSETCKRIGQDYAYSDSLYEDGTLSNILMKLLNCILDDSTPNYLKGSILTISQELFVSVKSKVWEGAFIKIWTKIIVPNYESIDNHNNYFKFTCKALSIISSPNVIETVIIDCLSHAKENNDNSIRFLYHLMLAKKKSNISKTNKLVVAITKFINTISDPMEFTIAGNIEILLSAGDKSIIRKKIEHILKGDKIPQMTLYSTSFFAKNDTKNNELIQKSIVANIKLWDTGFIKEKDRNGASPPNFLELSEFYKNIKWDKNILIGIYKRLKENFNLLKGSNIFNEDQDPNFFPIKYDSLLNEMFWFLCNFEQKLQGQDNYQFIKDEIHKELIKKRGFVNINDALMSNDANTVTKGLNELYRSIKTSKIEDHTFSINLMLDRALFKKIEGLLHCLSYIAFYTKNYSPTLKTLPGVDKKLLSILQQYSKDSIQDMNMDVPNAVKYCVAIATFLKKIGVISERIDYWLDLKKSKRFNWN